MMAARGVRTAARNALQAKARYAPRSLAFGHATSAIVVSLDDQKATNWSLFAAALGSAAVATVALSGEDAARCETKHAKAPVVSLGSGEEGVGGASTPTASGASASLAGEEAKPRGRRQLLKSRTRHKAKLEEVDLMKIHLDEYKATRASITSLQSRFELYASKRLNNSEKGAPAMTFTDFVHSMILPRFHTRLPHPDVEYKCDFVGNADGLISYEECYLLIHLLQIPKEHFDVAFCMFDLDGDGAVDKKEFSDVIEKLLHAINVKTHEPQLNISAEATLPRLTKYLFGQFGKKTIRAAELEAALDVLRKQILQAEFDLYAKPHPTKKGGPRVISVHDFAITLLSCFDADRLPPYLERVERLNASDELVTWDEFYNFHFHVQSHLADIKLAFELTGAEEVTETDFIHAAHVVTGVELSFPVVQLTFRVFDGNDNGTLDRSELMKVLEMRTNIDLQQRHGDTKFQRFWQCAKGRAE